MLKSILNSLVWWPLPTRLLNTAHIKERLSHISPITWQHVNFGDTTLNRGCTLKTAKFAKRGSSDILESLQQQNQ